MDCPICLDNLEKGGVYGTECGHVFHAQCLTKWKVHHSTCPMCRHNIGTVQTDSQFVQLLEELFSLYVYSNT